MAMRELVTGGAACAASGSSSSSSNPLGALANALIGTSSKTQERLKEIPTATPTTSDSQFYSETSNHFTALPGSEFDHQLLQPNAQVSEFLGGFRSGNHNGFSDVWNEIQLQSQPSFENFPPPPPPQLQPTLEGPPQRVLSSFLHSFVESSRGGVPFRPTSLPLLGLSEGDKQCIRDRSSIMARHFFADKSEDFINAQVNSLLSSLEIDSDARVKGPLPGRYRELEDYWNESQGMLKPGPQPADGWVAEYSQHRAAHDNPNAWAHSFEQQHGVNGWASEFEQEQSQLASVDQLRGVNISNAMEQTRMLAHTLAQNNDPKFQNSKFLQFVSRMSRGELIIDDNQVKAAPMSAPGDWAVEYQQQYDGGPDWAREFKHNEFSLGAKQWVDEFAVEQEQHGTVDDQWVNEFSKLHVNDWVEEFGQQVGDASLGDTSADSWVNAYDDFLNEQVATKQWSDASRRVYVFSDMNPYVGHPNPLKEGQELFRKGLLSEAVLALEAEVLKNPDNAEGWRLLGIAHAENDDDQQAIAAMMRAQEADPTNLEVLLALGVSHTNELEQAAALKYLYGWLHHHPKYGTLATPELPDSLYYADVSRLFIEASRVSPDDADIHIVLGVLYNLSREYDKAIESFQTALKLRPQDYSLWNKLGATQANSVQSADAILAYQQALDLKPNYVRAWANMGGMYEDSIRYYVRALAMNPKSDNAWKYLSISLSSASRNDMLEACNLRNLDVLQKEFPL
ncbi:peroxisome biogenesis protein 5 isoform X2 [Mangifera indica]|uniref:peroxisome biogenesis protein 5 isoform X2 n=1 Tax=Mangifera indica TaxID=29780 RepID=UPI001CF9BA6C|nr:peroxisome biogenesis protein 5 isoform X2 [Mangifera indica]